MSYCMNTTMNCTIMVIFIAKILSDWFFLIMGNVKRMLSKLINTLILSGRNRYYKSAG